MPVIQSKTKCEFCQCWSERWTTWPSCRECLRYTCPRCASFGSEEGGDGRPVTVLCMDCAYQDTPMRTTVKTVVMVVWWTLLFIVAVLAAQGWYQWLTR